MSELIKSDLSPESVRTKIAEVQRTTADNYLKYEEIVNKITNDMIGLLQQGAAIDVDHIVGNYLDDERSAKKQKARSEKSFQQLLRLAANKRPDLLKAINEAAAAEAADIERMARLHRDMRWRLMEARALHQPSKGVGPIRGEHTDLDVLLKS